MYACYSWRGRSKDSCVLLFHTAEVMGSWELILQLQCNTSLLNSLWLTPDCPRNFALESLPSHIKRKMLSGWSELYTVWEISLTASDLQYIHRAFHQIICQRSLLFVIILILLVAILIEKGSWSNLSDRIQKQKVKWNLRHFCSILNSRLF